ATACIANIQETAVKNVEIQIQRREERHGCGSVFGRRTERLAGRGKVGRTAVPAHQDVPRGILRESSAFLPRTTHQTKGLFGGEVRRQAGGENIVEPRPVVGGSVRV